MTPGLPKSSPPTVRNPLPDRLPLLKRAQDRDLDTAGQDDRYGRAAAEFGPALERLARAVEADASERHDLLQNIHFALWRSMAAFVGRCSLRTWVYRVAHNTAASHITARRRAPKGLSIEELELADDHKGPEEIAGDNQALERLMALIRGLKAPDSQVMLLYLEELSAEEIGEITSLSAGAVATKIHRIKTFLARRF
jgi:RNA polymerase sigma-70 factor (ECF subfamily)